MQDLLPWFWKKYSVNLNFRHSNLMCQKMTSSECQTIRMLYWRQLVRRASDSFIISQLSGCSPLRKNCAAVHLFIVDGIVALTQPWQLISGPDWLMSFFFGIRWLKGENANETWLWSILLIKKKKKKKRKPFAPSSEKQLLFIMSRTE